MCTYPLLAPVSAHSIDVSRSLNSSPPRAAASFTACTPSTAKIEVKIEVRICYNSACTYIDCTKFHNTKKFTVLCVEGYYVLLYTATIS